MRNEIKQLLQRDTELLRATSQAGDIQAFEKAAQSLGATLGDLEASIRGEGDQEALQAGEQLSQDLQALHDTLSQPFQEVLERWAMDELNDSILP